MVERVNITTNRILLRNASCNTVFDTNNQYIRTDTCENFVVDYAVQAPRPSTISAMGECTGSLIMFDCMSTNCCFDCCFAFPEDGFVSIEPALCSQNYSESTNYSGGSKISVQPYVCIEVFQCDICCTPSFFKTYCFAPRLVDWNQGQANSGCFFFLAEPQQCFSMGDTPQPSQTGAWCQVAAGCFQAPGVNCAYNTAWYNSKPAWHTFRLDKNSYLRICRDTALCYYQYGSASTPLYNACLPVTLNFRSSGCLPLAVTC